MPALIINIYNFCSRYVKLTGCSISPATITFNQRPAAVRWLSHWLPSSFPFSLARVRSLRTRSLARSFFPSQLDPLHCIHPARELAAISLVRPSVSRCLTFVSSNRWQAVVADSVGRWASRVAYFLHPPVLSSLARAPAFPPWLLPSPSSLASFLPLPLPSSPPSLSRYAGTSPPAPVTEWRPAMRCVVFLPSLLELSLLSSLRLTRAAWLGSNRKKGRAEQRKEVWREEKSVPNPMCVCFVAASSIK